MSKSKECPARKLLRAKRPDGGEQLTYVRCCRDKHTDDRHEDLLGRTWRDGTA